MRRLLVMCALLALVAQAGVAVTPETMSYQGVLTDAVGSPVPDGFYNLTFRIYMVPVAGVSLWTETQNVFVEDGIFDVILGDVNPIGLPFDTQYYLATQVGAAPELTPRTQLTSASYAFRAKYADTGAPDGDWTIGGADIYRLTGSVGIGAIPPTDPMMAQEKDGVPVEPFDRGANKLYVQGQDQKVVYSYVYNSTGNTGTAALYGYRDSDGPSHGTSYAATGSNAAVTGYNFWGDNYAFGVAGYSWTDYGLCGGVLGSNYSGTTWGALGYRDGGIGYWGVYTPDATYLGGAIQIPTGATAGYVLTSDAAGNATWQAGGGGGFTLPYAGAGSSTTPLFELEQTGTGETAMFLNDSSWEDIVGVGMSGTPNKMWLSSGFGWASISGSDTNRDDIVIQHSSGNVGIGTTSPSNALDVAGTVETQGFQMGTGATNGYVLTSNASGIGTWQAAASGMGGSGTANYIPKFTAGTTLGNSIAYETGGRIGIGTTSPASRFTVNESTSGQALEVNSTFVGTAGRLVDFSRSSDPLSGNDMVQIVVPSTAPDGFQFLELERGSDVKFAVHGDGDFNADGTGTIDNGIVVTNPSSFNGDVTVTGQLDVNSTTTRAGAFTSGYESSATHVVHGEFEGTTSSDAVAVYGYAVPTSNYGIGGQFHGGYYGVQGYAEGDNPYAGVYGSSSGGTGSGTRYGVRGYASGGYTNYGVYGYTGSTGTNFYGVYSSGNMHVSGTLSKTAGAFKIDHPLDPANMYLQHSFVESPDMMNIYNGNAVLDARGEAWVEMPEWFEALNRDFRYQLTSIGAPGPNLYVAEEISGNQFKIAGGESGMKVSWQVTGVRQDRYAQEHRIQVEVQKTATEAGKYMHPELFGAPETMAVDYDERRAIEDTRAGSKAQLPVIEEHPTADE
jgi:hypothetical protein